MTPPDPMAGMKPVGWGAGRNRAATGDVLYLREMVVIRRLRAGESQAQAARSLGWSKNVVTGLLRHARVRLGAATVADLLELPCVAAQLEADGAA